ncbi:MAG: L-aspartate oxidase [Candidatus Poribacteria bacterium]|nr:L-aspartate oxidase [Candidatus Poribacteria bacterium]
MHIPRHLVPFDTRRIQRIETDFLIVGSGNAGLRAAIEASGEGSVVLLSKENVNEGATRYAQGGIAVVMNKEDTIEAHVRDTLDAGAGLCHLPAVQTMVAEGVDRVAELLEWGAEFDRDKEGLAFGLEGAHSVRRVAHKGDSTGEEMQSALAKKALSHPNVSVLEHTFVIDLLTDSGACVGALALRPDGELTAVFAKATILAAGGLGQLYKRTSNPSVATGDGMAMAFRAGAALTDMEFFQFHPTALYMEGKPRFLISEAARGEGAQLLNIRGERFMIAYDEREELAPRDIVTRAVLAETMRARHPCVYLDLTKHSREFLEKRFPNILCTLRSYGVEIWRDVIPVQAAAHFMMGGVWTDRRGRTSLPNLFACGEAACSMAHGANRLASNSLLEGLVFGRRAGRSAVKAARRHEGPVWKPLSADASETPPPRGAQELRERLQERMWEEAGILRSAESLESALNALEKMPLSGGTDRADIEYSNMRILGELLARAALERVESRGAHFRLDRPERDDANWKRRVYFARGENGTVRMRVSRRGPKGENR